MFTNMDGVYHIIKFGLTTNKIIKNLLMSLIGLIKLVLEYIALNERGVNCLRRIFENF